MNRYSRKGIGTDGGITYPLATALKVTAGQQATFGHYKKLAKRGSDGEVVLCTAGATPVGVFIDVSPQGNSASIETEGFEAVLTSEACTYGDLVTPDDGGLLKKIAGAAPTLAELTAGVWQVDEVVSTAEVIICLDSRL